MNDRERRRIRDSACIRLAFYLWYAMFIGWLWVDYRHVTCVSIGWDRDLPVSASTYKIRKQIIRREDWIKIPKFADGHSLPSSPSLFFLPLKAMILLLSSIAKPTKSWFQLFFFRILFSERKRDYIPFPLPYLTILNVFYSGEKLATNQQYYRRMNMWRAPQSRFMCHQSRIAPIRFRIVPFVV